MTKKSDTNVISLPYQFASAESLRNCYDDEIIGYQLRANGVELIRLIQAGKLAPTEEIIQNLKNINESLVVYGKPTLSLDFLN